MDRRTHVVGFVIGAAIGVDHAVTDGLATGAHTGDTDIVIGAWLSIVTGNEIVDRWVHTVTDAVDDLAFIGRADVIVLARVQGALARTVNTDVVVSARVVVATRRVLRRPHAFTCAAVA